MTILADVLRIAHIVFGAAGLLVMLAPLLLRKGSRWHRRTGWVFVGAMGGASVTAACLAGLRIGQLVQSGAFSIRSAAMSIFLLDVAVLTLASLWYGVRVLRTKKRSTPHTSPVDRGITVMLAVVSLGTLAVAFMTGNAVLFTLPIVGLMLAALQMREMLHAPRDPMFWWYSHMGGMIGGCIAAVTAMLVVNSANIAAYVPVPPIVLWIGPSVIGVAGLLVWMGRYRRQFAGAGRRERRA